METEPQTSSTGLTEELDALSIPISYYHFGDVPFTDEEKSAIQQQLDSKLPPNCIAFRVGPSNRTNHTPFNVYREGSVHRDFSSN